MLTPEKNLYGFLFVGHFPTFLGMVPFVKKALTAQCSQQFEISFLSKVLHHKLNTKSFRKRKNEQQQQLKWSSEKAEYEMS